MTDCLLWFALKEDTHWYRSQEAVKEYQEAWIELLRPLFEQMGVDIDSA